MKYSGVVGFIGLLEVFSKPRVKWDVEEHTRYAQNMLLVDVKEFSSWIGGVYTYGIF